MMFSHLYTWLAEGEMTGRYIFDLGQSLYEGGRPEIGRPQTYIPNMGYLFLIFKIFIPNLG
jgi:hypothetical protein